jgi:hypothetical protein
VDRQGAHVLTWRKVVYAADCDEDGNCPVCKIDYSECDCPGPTMDGFGYCWIDGELHAQQQEDDDMGDPQQQPSEQPIPQPPPAPPAPPFPEPKPAEPKHDEPPPKEQD